MRIIAGGSRGRWIKGAPKDLPVKPISARIKKSLFDILRPRLEGAKFLDIYAGTGAVGIEALSRGAALAVFLEREKKCLALIEENLGRIGFKEFARVLPGDALQDLSWVPFRAGVEKFDIVFMGPPYRTLDNTPLAYSTPTLARVAEAGLLAPGGWALLQRHKKEKVELPAAFERFREERYGDTDVEFLRLKA